MKSHKIRNTLERDKTKKNGDKTKFTEQRHCQSENENKTENKQKKKLN